MSVHIKSHDLDTLEGILAKLAANEFAGPQRFFKYLVDKADLPQAWRQGIAGAWTGNANYDARALINWAIARDVNPSDRRYTTLGSILQALLQHLGFQDASTIAAMIIVYQLFLDKKLLENIQMRYQVPQLLSAVLAGKSDLGPDFDWQGPTEIVELQSWLKPSPDLQDVGF